MTRSNTETQAAEATSAQESDPLVKSLERKKKIAQLEKETAEAQRDTLNAKLPKTKGSGISGDVTFGEGSGYFAELLAYQAMIEVAGQVATGLGVPSTAGDRILVVTVDDFAKAAHLWEIANTRIDDANQRLQDLLAPAKGKKALEPQKAGAEVAGVVAAVTTTAALLSAAADIASFFRSELTVTAKEVKVTSTALVAATAARLRDQGWLPILPSSSLKKTTLLEKIDTLLGSRRQLAEHLRQIEETAQSALKGKVAAEIDASLTATDALIKALVEGSEGKPSAVEVVAAVDVAKSDDKLKILQLETSSQGGEIHVTKSAFRTRLTYVGGVAVSYLLLDQEGGVEKSGVIVRPIARSTPVRKAASQLAIPGHR